MKANVHVVSILLLALITLSLGVIVYGVVGGVLQEPEVPRIEPLPRLFSAEGIYYSSGEGYKVEVNVNVSECPSLDNLSALLLGKSGDTWDPVAVGYVEGCRDGTARVVFQVKDLAYDGFRVALIKMGARSNEVPSPLTYVEPPAGSSEEGN